MRRITLRDCQINCADEFTDVLHGAVSRGAKPEFSADMCVGSGKSTAMAYLASQMMLGEDGSEINGLCPADYSLFICPAKSIVGHFATDKTEASGLIGALMSYDIRAFTSITPGGRMPGFLATPSRKLTDAGYMNCAAVLTYQYLRQPKVLETLEFWASEGLRIAAFFDEAHHLPEGGTSWSDAAKRVRALSVCNSAFSGTWGRSDQKIILGQGKERNAADFVYSYADGLRDQIVRRLSFWAIDYNAYTWDKATHTVIDTRPVGDYMGDIPAGIRQAMFDPNGDYVGEMIRRADHELTQRRHKYKDAGCLVVCPPGRMKGEDEMDEEDESRIAEIIHKRVESITGKRAVLILNKHPASRINEYRHSDAEFLVAVRRVSEGCDIPRLRMELILTDITSDLLFTQILGRIIRRRKDDDDEPALVIMPPISRMCEWAMNVEKAKIAMPTKPVVLCVTCGRDPCACPKPPCRTCNERPCVCLCKYCHRKCLACVCPPNLDYFVSLENQKNTLIFAGRYQEDEHSQCAINIRDNHEPCRSNDPGKMAEVLRGHAIYNGSTVTPGQGVGHQDRAIRLAGSWDQKRKYVFDMVLQYGAKYAPKDSVKPQWAWNFVNKTFLPGTTWKTCSDDPSILTLEKLQEIQDHIEPLLRK